MSSATEFPLPVELRLALLDDAAARDIVTARRSILLRIIWQESFLSGAGLVYRTEAVVGRGSFGASAMATFRRDIRALKGLLKQAGFTLRFSRTAGRSGYYVVGRPDLAPELVTLIEAGMQDVDLKQIEMAANLSPGDRVWQAAQLSDGLFRMAVHRLQQERPDMGAREAYWKVRHAYDERGA